MYVCVWKKKKIKNNELCNNKLNLRFLQFFPANQKKGRRKIDCFAKMAHFFCFVCISDVIKK
jgi:hypothetical protein